MEPSRAEVLDWLEEWIGGPLTPAKQADILKSIGDEDFGLMNDFSARFGVDMSAYRPEMHQLPNGPMWQSSWPIPVHPRHGVLMPLSVTLLHRAAADRRWPVRYPDLPVMRNWSWINLPLTFFGLIGATLLAHRLVPWLF